MTIRIDPVCSKCQTTLSLHIRGECPMNGGQSAGHKLYRNNWRALVGNARFVAWLTRHNAHALWDKHYTKFTYLAIAGYIAMCVYVYGLIFGKWSI